MFVSDKTVKHIFTSVSVISIAHCGYLSWLMCRKSTLYQIFSLWVNKSSTPTFQLSDESRVVQQFKMKQFLCNCKITHFLLVSAFSKGNSLESKRHTLIHTHTCTHVHIDIQKTRSMVVFHCPTMATVGL